MEVSEVARKENTEKKQKKKQGASKPGPEASREESCPAEEDTRRRAYLIYRERAGTPGSPVADWFQAERSLREEREQRKVEVVSEGAADRESRGKSAGRGGGRGKTA
jgi:hypothetical protein